MLILFGGLYSETMDEIIDIKNKIVLIRKELEHAIIDSKEDYETILEISRKLDQLIILYYYISK